MLYRTDNLFVFIMAGGQGTRFWPASTSKRPKQFLKLFGDNSLLTDTARRFTDWLSPDQVFVITNRSYLSQTREHVSEVPPENLVGEPVGRNTAPCVALASQIAHQLDPESTMIVVPADHHIADVDAFHTTLQLALKVAREEGALTTLGIKPDRPATGYGYIKRATALESGGYRVDRFVEKPSLERAQEYLVSGDYYWNSGMFVWNTEAIREAFKACRPAILAPIAGIESQHTDPQFVQELERIYPTLESISIDYAIMERANSIAVIPAVFGWDDVGSWAALERHVQSDPSQNILLGEDVVALDTQNTTIKAETRRVAALGIRDMLIVESQGNILVAPKARAQEVKILASEVAVSWDDPSDTGEWRFGDAVPGAPRVVDKPWGREVWWAVDDRYVGKILEVSAGSSLSLQYHEEKTETMFFQQGTGVVQLNDTLVPIVPGKAIHIKPGTIHRIKAQTDLVIFEVSTPEVDDVVRLEDDYGRLRAEEEVAATKR